MLHRNVIALLCATSVGVISASPDSVYESRLPTAESRAPSPEPRRSSHESPAPSAEFRQASQFDLLIRRARVFDGSGNPWFVADVAVKDGRIAAIGDLGAAQAGRTIDATNKYLSPGFIDIHSHSDRGLGDNSLRYNVNMVAQGITLSVVNQADGRSFRFETRRRSTRNKASVRMPR
jgi:hypothetical protein